MNSIQSFDQQLRYIGDFRSHSYPLNQWKELLADRLSPPSGDSFEFCSIHNNLIDYDRIANSLLDEYFFIILPEIIRIYGYSSVIMFHVQDCKNLFI